MVMMKKMHRILKINVFSKNKFIKVIFRGIIKRPGSGIFSYLRINPWLILIYLNGVNTENIENPQPTLP